jgi:hypothetical protein
MSFIPPVPLSSKTFLTQHPDEAGIHLTKPGSAPSQFSPPFVSNSRFPAASAAAAKYSSTALLQGSEAPESSELSESSRLHFLLKQLRQLDEELKSKKLSYENRMKLVNEGEMKFLDKQSNTIKYLRRFKGFIVETDSKRLRSEKKEMEESRLKEMKLNEMNELKVHLMELIQQKVRLEGKMKFYKYYKFYLESVLQVSEQYGEIDELINRYGILSQTHSDLRVEQEKWTNEMEFYQQKLQQMTKVSANELLVKNSYYARLIKQYEELNAQAAVNTSQLREEARKQENVERTIIQISAAIKNISSRSIQKARQPKNNLKIMKQQQQAKIAAAMAGQQMVAEQSGIEENAGSGVATGESEEVKSPQGSSGSGPSQDQLHLQAHLITLLDSIAERVTDLQFIRDACVNSHNSVASPVAAAPPTKEEKERQTANKSAQQARKTSNQV